MPVVDYQAFGKNLIVASKQERQTDIGVVLMLIVAVSAVLDAIVQVQAQVIDLLGSVHTELGLPCPYIAHD